MTTTSARDGRDRTRRVELLDRIGGGAHGEVWRARDTDGAIVAVKIMGGPGITKESRLRFFQEQAFRFDHPNIAGPLGTTTVDGDPALVMELVDGCTLQTLADANGGTLADPVLLIVARAALAGLAYLHERNIVHRDISPDNLLVALDDTRRLVTRIGDFGSALDLEGPRLTTTAGAVGTIGFVAPEVLAGAEASASSDLYSLGATLRAVRATPPVSPAPNLAALLVALEGTEPERRPASASDAAALLGPANPTLPVRLVVPRLPPAPAPSRQRRGRGRLAAAVLVAALIGAGVTAFVVERNGSGRSAAPAAASGAAGGDARSTDAPWQAGISEVALSGYDSAVALDADGLPSVAHTEFGQGRLLVTRCGDVVCSPSRTRTVTVSARDRSGYFPSIAFTADGRAVVASQNSSLGRLEVRECGDAGCARRGEADVVPIGAALSARLRTAFATVSPTSNITQEGLNPKIVLRGDEVAVLYNDAVAQHVRLARRVCAEECRWIVTDIGPGNNGAVEVLPDGRFVVTGTSGQYGPLWIAVCDDLACSSTTRIEPGVAGVTPDLAVTDTGVTAVVSTLHTGDGDFISEIVRVDVPIPACADPGPGGCPEIGAASVRPLGALDDSWTPNVVTWDDGIVVAYRTTAPGGLGLLVCEGAAACREVRADAVVRRFERKRDGGHDASIAIDAQGRVFASHSVLPPTDENQFAGSLAVFSATVEQLLPGQDG